MAAHSNRRLDDPLAPPPSRRPGPILAMDVACERRETTLELQQCLTDYVNANALRDKSSPCHACAQGLETRIAYAKGML